MNMPGFTAASALWPGYSGYRMAGGFETASGAVVPQACDPVCLDNCPDPSDCDEVPIHSRAACLRAVAQCRRRCCPTPPPPPPPVCGPCTAGACDPTTCTRGPGSQRCCDSAGQNCFTRAC